MVHLLVIGATSLCLAAHSLRNCFTPRFASRFESQNINAQPTTKVQGVILSFCLVYGDNHEF